MAPTVVCVYVENVRPWLLCVNFNCEPSFCEDRNAYFGIVLEICLVATQEVPKSMAFFERIREILELDLEPSLLSREIILSQRYTRMVSR